MSDYITADSLLKEAEALKHIIIEKDAGQMPIGEKRNLLLDRAEGEYIAYVDDDDLISEDYVKSILDAMADKPDCVGMEGLLVASNAQLLFKHSIQFAGWYQAGDVYYRTPNHLNPIRAELARLVGFDASSSHGEDEDYSKEIRQYLRTEKYIDHPIYYYNCLHVVVKKNEAKK
jgi:glycosyltransferase involved in cell wall biosynthesis